MYFYKIVKIIRIKIFQNQFLHYENILWESPWKTVGDAPLIILYPSKIACAQTRNTDEKRKPGYECLSSPFTYDNPEFQQQFSALNLYTFIKLYACNIFFLLFHQIFLSGVPYYVMVTEGNLMSWYPSKPGDALISAYPNSGSIMFYLSDILD